MVSPAITVAVSGGIVPPPQYDLSPPLTGANTTEHEQVGAVTTTVFSQPLASVTLTVIFKPDKTPVIDQTLLPVFVTVPELLVTVPEFTVTLRE
jgi:hypothetical protein